MLDFILLSILIVAMGGSVWMVTNTLRAMKMVSFRRLYLQCVARLDIVAVLLNQMEPLAKHVDSKLALDRYEEALKMMESLLTALNKVPILPSGKELVGSLEPMVKRLEEASNDALAQFRKSSKLRRL